MTTTEVEPRCQNQACNKLLINRRAGTKYCDNSCNYAAKHVRTGEDGEERPVFISSGCKYPRQQQATIVPGDRKHRHPYAGNRPEWSGYCVIRQCECVCHPWNKEEEVQ